MSNRLTAFVVSTFLLAVVVLTLSGMPASADRGGQSGPSASLRAGTARSAQVCSTLFLALEQARDKFESEMASLRGKLAEEMAALERRIAKQAGQSAERAGSFAEEQARRAEEWGRAFAERFEEMEPPALPDEERGWLGVSVEEVTAEKAKQLKLPAERGVLVEEVSAESPAAEAGLKAGDVITEFNGQRVEGTAQFRRLVRETPAGRTVQLGVWRAGGSQTLTAKLGSLGEHGPAHVRVFGPHDLDFEIGVPPMPLVVGPAPMLGIEADEIGGQLARYFGVPDGDGILVREVRPGSPAEKAGLKAGDVITKADGERVQTILDLRSKLHRKRDQKSISLSVIRHGAETSLNVEMEPAKPPSHSRMFSRHTVL